MTWKEVVERARVVTEGKSRSLVQDVHYFATYIVEEDKRREEHLLAQRGFVAEPNADGGVTVSHSIRGKIVHTPGMGILSEDPEDLEGDE